MKNSALLFCLFAFFCIVKPVFADKAILQPSADSFINSTTANTNINYGTNQLLRLSKKPTEQNSILVKFDLSSVPKGVKVTKATLRFHQEAYTGDNTIISLGINIYPLSSNWNEKSVTWNNHPAKGIALIQPNKQPYFVYSKQEYDEWDILPIVQDWIDNITPNYGLSLEVGGNGWYNTFTSKEGNLSFQPELSIIYTPNVTPTPTKSTFQILPLNVFGLLKSASPTPTETPSPALTPSITPTPTTENKWTDNIITPVPKPTDTVTPAIQEKPKDVFSEVVTATNIKIAAIAIFVLVALVLLSRR
jgi:hypothetical protein